MNRVLGDTCAGKGPCPAPPSSVTAVGCVERCWLVLHPRDDKVLFPCGDPTTGSHLNCPAASTDGNGEPGRSGDGNTAESKKKKKNQRFLPSLESWLPFGPLFDSTPLTPVPQFTHPSVEHKHLPVWGRANTLELREGMTVFRADVLRLQPGIWGPGP